MLFEQPSAICYERPESHLMVPFNTTPFPPPTTMPSNTNNSTPDDLPTLHASRAYARNEFNNHSKLDSGSMEAAQGIEHAQGVTKILREHVVQGKHQGEGKYKLNIHEHTQRLDNDTAGQLKGTTKSFKEVKDAVF